jgi:predicted secreted Zn-dependent protease
MTLRVLPAGAITAGVHHTFNETTLSAVSNSMSQMEEAAKTEFEFEMSFQTAGGRVSNVELAMSITVDMPVWSKVSSRPQAEQTEWNRFLLALRAHEDGHVDICRREAPTAFARVSAARPGNINDVLERERLRIIAVNEAYDRRTDHGRTQNTPHGNTTITIPAAPPPPPRP